MRQIKEITQFTMENGTSTPPLEIIFYDLRQTTIKLECEKWEQR